MRRKSTARSTSQAGGRFARERLSLSGSSASTPMICTASRSAFEGAQPAPPQRWASTRHRELHLSPLAGSGRERSERVRGIFGDLYAGGESPSPPSPRKRGEGAHRVYGAM